MSLKKSQKANIVNRALLLLVNGIPKLPASIKQKGQQIASLGTAEIETARIRSISMRIRRS